MSTITTQQIYHQYEQELETEKAALSGLGRDARRYEEAVRTRCYIAGVRSAATEAVGGSEELSEGVIEWLAWADQKADWLDPLVPCSDILLDAPRKKKPSYW